MDKSEWNRKVAISRWKNLLAKQVSQIPNDKDSLLIKAGICGLLAGDGSVQYRKAGTFYRYQLDFFPDDDIMLKTYCEFMQKIYSSKPAITRKNNYYVVRLFLKFIAQDLLKECKFGIYTWDLPNTLLSIDGAKELWLRGFFSAEGYVNKKYIKTQSVNIKGMQKVSSLLTDLGIPNRTYEYTPKNPNHSKVLMLFILSKEARIQYCKKIGFWHSKKERLLKESLGL